MTWPSFIELMSLSLATKVQFLLNFWFENAPLTLLGSKLACFWHNKSAFSAEEQCFPKAGHIQAFIQHNGGIVNQFQLYVISDFVDYHLLNNL